MTASTRGSEGPNAERWDSQHSYPLVVTVLTDTKASMALCQSKQLRHCKGAT